MRKTDNLEYYRAFCTVAACGSVREAGATLSVEPSNLSRMIRQLETELDAALFEPQSRPAKLTPQGEVLYEHAQALLREHSALLDAMHEGLDAESGLIQVASSAEIRHQLLAPALVEYQQEHPEVSIELRDLVIGARNFFMAADGTTSDVVLAFKTHEPLPEGTLEEVLSEVPLVACASPIYLKKNGAPATPADCAKHRGVELKLPGRSSSDHLFKGDQCEPIRWKSASTYYSQIDAVDALVLGAGICIGIGLPSFVRQQEKGRLTEVLAGWSCPPQTACLYVNSYAKKKRRVQRFAEWVAKRYRAYIAESLEAWKRP